MDFYCNLQMCERNKVCVFIKIMYIFARLPIRKGIGAIDIFCSWGGGGNPPQQLLCFDQLQLQNLQQTRALKPRHELQIMTKEKISISRSCNIFVILCNKFFSQFCQPSCDMINEMAHYENHVGCPQQRDYHSKRC